MYVLYVLYVLCVLYVLYVLCVCRVRGVQFHPSGLYVVSVSEDRSLRCFDISQGTGSVVRTVANAHGHFVTCVAIHPTQPVMVTGGVDKMVNLWRCR